MERKKEGRLRVMGREAEWQERGGKVEVRREIGSEQEGNGEGNSNGMLGCC
jgi:hypothetical protein